MKKNTTEILAKLLDTNKKNSTKMDSSSTLNSAFSFKNYSTASKKNQFKTNDAHNKINIDKKLFDQIFEILKMRMFIEVITSLKDNEIKDIINENLKLINLRNYDIRSINKFVDDLIEIIKLENKNKQIAKLENSKKIEESLNETLNQTQKSDFLNGLRRNTIKLESKGYRPTSLVSQRRNTVEIFLEKPFYGVLNQSSFKFNKFEKLSKKEYSMYEGDPYNAENNKYYDSEGLAKLRDNLIEEVQENSQN